MYTNGEEKYNSHEFSKLRDDHGISENPLMNKAVERLGQTLHTMANTILKNFDFEFSY